MRKVFLDKLPKSKSGKSISWKKSVGYKVNFIYDEIEGYLEIVDYKNNYLTIKYKNKIKLINTGAFTNCNLGELFKKSMWITDKELCVKLGIPQKVAETVTRYSEKPIIFPCKYCGDLITAKPKRIIINKSISCKKCSDGKSYPEKIMYSILKQLKIEFDTEYSPKYLKREEKGKLSQKRNDFYLKNLNIVIEVDGGLGHEGGIVHGKSKRTLEECIEIDKWKEEQNLKHGIKTIRINCFESNLDYIKNNILSSELSELFDLSKINWEECEKYALKNIVKEVCEYWHKHREINEENIFPKDLSIIFNCCTGTILDYLHKGTKIGWCNYNKKQSLKLKNYNKKQSLKLKNKDRILIGCKPILMYDKNMNFLGEYESASWLERNSEELFGVKLIRSKIGETCNGKRKTHKGYIFKHK